MKKRLIAIFLLIILLPLALITWLGWRTIKDEQERNRHRFEAVLSARLRDVDERIQGLLAKQEADFLQMAGVYSMPIDEIRSFSRKSRLIRQIFLIDPEGQVVFPNSDAMALSSKEEGFCIRTQSLGLSAHLFRKPQENAVGRGASSGWFTWFWEEGINFIYWQSVESGGILGIEVERIALIADIVAALPDSDVSNPGEPDGRIVLADVKGDTIYQWGAYRPGEGVSPLASISLSLPLSAWKLNFFADQTGDPGSLFTEGYFSLASGILALIVALSGLAIYFYRESSRTIREALRKVSFVNQVSHELKTPLTNLRMYAELLEREIPDGAERARGYLGVLVSESRRLSRLIHNILTFSGKESRNRKLHMERGIIDSVISGVIENFRPALELKGVTIEFVAGAGEEALFDGDILEQIVNNLVSNVEQYAVSGKYLKIETGRDGENVMVRVSDRGPGIPARERKRIFMPFVRLSSKLTDGISGTGIGLTIARDLALLHGGSLELLPAEQGAVFQLVVRAERADRESGEGK